MAALPGDPMIPASGRSTPVSARASSVRPEPSRPAKPSTSPSTSSTSASASRCRGHVARARGPARRRRRPLGAERAASSAALRPSIFWTRSMRSSSRGEVLADERAVAQHRDAVADLVDLVEEVRDEEDGDAALLELADHPEQLGDLVERRGSRSARRARAPCTSVEIARAIATSCCTASEWRAEQRGRVDVEPELGEHRRARRAHPRPVDHAAAGAARARARCSRRPRGWAAGRSPGRPC